MVILSECEESRSPIQPTVSTVELSGVEGIDPGMPLARAQTMSGALKRMLSIMKRGVIKGQLLHVAVMHADALNNALALKDSISSRFQCAELFITEFTPVMGAHIGPGLVGVAFYSGD